MTIAKPIDITKNIKHYLDKAFSGDTILVPCEENKNVVVISQNEYEDLQKMKRNTEYLAMLDESMKQLEQGKTISFTMEELREMESDDWKPTPKVLDWMKRMEQENE